MSREPRIFVNIPASAPDTLRIAREERTWSGPRLVALGAATLASAFVLLYAMAQTTSETTWSDWLFPG